MHTQFKGAVAFAIVAKDANLEHIVGLTQWMPSPSHPSLMTRRSWLVDLLLSMRLGDVRNGHYDPFGNFRVLEKLPEGFSRKVASKLCVISRFNRSISW
jgi:hypothetical protein